jgi:phage shock protein E
MNTVTRRSLGHLLAAACLVIAGTGALQAQTIGAADGRALVARGALLVDVRSAQEFSTGHVEGAINIPHLDVGKRLAEFGDNRDRDILLYCRSGHRAGLAQQSLQALGYTHVYNAGGYEDWLSADAAK